MSLLVFSLRQKALKKNKVTCFLFLLSGRHVTESDLAATSNEGELEVSQNWEGINTCKTCFVYIIVGMAFWDCSEFTMIQTR
jgi:hypothetical protein